MNKKKDFFNSALIQIKNWYKDYFGLSNDDQFNINNDLSFLKILNLHFFICSQNEDLIQIFDQFHAFSFGSIENDLRKLIINNDYFFQEISMKRNMIIYKNEDETAFNKKIRDAVYKLRNENNHLISYRSFHLINLIKRWDCYQTTRELVDQKKAYNNKRKTEDYLIRRNLIKRSKKFYFL